MEPLRTCVACGHKGGKSALQRFVWGDDSPRPDTDGCAPGRGAYCCRDERCFERFAGQRKKWKRVFRL